MSAVKPAGSEVLSHDDYHDATSLVRQRYVTTQ